MSRLSSDLLKQAKDLASQDPNRPKDASIRRAISTAYYALFHFLLDEASGNLVGASRNGHLLSRCFGHGQMLKACETILGLVKQPNYASVYAPFARSIQNRSNDLQVVAKTFKDLQEHRHRAESPPHRDDIIDRAVGRTIGEADRPWNRHAKRSVARSCT
jgi:hypothetical protein